MIARARIWWTILRIALQERLVYRGDFALGTLMRFLPIVTQIFLWYAVFQARDGKPLAGFRYQDFVAYYLLTMVARAFSSMPGLASGIAAQIRSGEVKKFLIQPIDMLSFLLLGRIAHKLAYYIVAAVPFALVFYLCRDFFPGWPSVTSLAAGVLALVLAFLLGYYLEACMGLVGFWWLEVSSLLFVYMLFSFFLSGHMFPLDILPEPWRSLVMLTPLPYLAYFPAAVLLGKIEGWDLVRGLATEAAWVAVFMVLSRIMFHYGAKKYSAFGG
jgi:ABC-2 type transport system permease protein